MLQVGIDIGSTTIKCVVIDEDAAILYKDYMRHKSSITKSFTKLVKGIQDVFNGQRMHVNVTGSAGMFLATDIGLQFTQEVISATTALRHEHDDFDVCIELGGEDAKIIFFDGNNIEQRMNGTCAGGTGAFIDQMATLLDTDSATLNELAKDYSKIYPIASRCGVFAKSDIQPLLNQGANHHDIAISIYQAIVNQTIAGLSQGRRIKGKIAFLGGPLTFASELRKRFIEFLELEDVYVPEHGEVFVAYGAALAANETEYTIDELVARVEAYEHREHKTIKKTLGALFETTDDHEAFVERHARDSVAERSLAEYSGNAYLGIDAGSTTTKLILLSEDNEILHYYYSSNKGNPVDVVKKALHDLYEQLPEDVQIAGAYSTGYGEALIREAFRLDGSEVETICHYRAASFFNPDVDFIIDIGGQDMKCFKIADNTIRSIILNEACSSGCGSFLETFSTSLGYPIRAFAELALDARQPVDLGSRCTVFMNSGVKQAQAEDATTADISAGLAYSVVKNALYKVIRTVDVRRDLGEHIVVQGGTFYNDAVLRAFEREIGMDVVRPNIAGLMGAFGAALLAKEAASDESSMLSATELGAFTYRTRQAVCRKCSNFCGLTINVFNDKTHISGNRCDKGAGIVNDKDDLPNLYLYKYERLMQYQSDPSCQYIGTVGIPMVLNMYENLPFWWTFFNELGYRVVYSDRSSKDLYELGQGTIPSDTACYPAKLVHGHIENLIQKDIDYLFYPNMPFNFIEKDYRDNEYNCPVVAFYPEVIKANVEELDLTTFYSPYVSLNKKEPFVQQLHSVPRIRKLVSKRRLRAAYDVAMEAYLKYRYDVFEEGERALEYAKANGKHIILLAGRPYHVDPEINHGIPNLLQQLDTVVISEDCVNFKADQDLVRVLNQWTYHTRLYDSAKFVTTLDNANLVQLISFGCGLDAITSDEVQSILESHDKIYTAIKIDEVNNLGTANIRLRSLLATMRGVV